LLLCQGGVRFQRVEGGADEESFEAADGFSSALAFGARAFEVGARRRVDAGLGDRDPVEGGVELAVAAAVEPVLATPPFADEAEASVTGSERFRVHARGSRRSVFARSVIMNRA
jgi:hypothetical protein